MNEITEEKLKAEAKRLIDSTVVDMNYIDTFLMFDEKIGIDLYIDFIVHQLLANAKHNIEKAWSE